MANTTFGEVSWDEESSGGGEKKSNNKDTFLRLDDGSNVVRLITRPHQYLVHKGIKRENDKGYGQKVNCSMANGSCTLCEQGMKPNQRWLLGVIDRKTSSYKILDISWQVFSQIKKLAKNTEVWGDPLKYDLDIVVDKNGGPTGYYSVQPRPHKPLSAADQQIRDNADLEDLKRRVVPPTPDVVAKRVEKILEGPATPGPGSSSKILRANTSNQSSNTNTKSLKPPVANTDDDDMDDIFPSYDG